MSKPPQDQGNPRSFPLLGSNFEGNFVGQDDDESHLPSQITKINFAQLKITDTLPQWGERVKANKVEKQGVGDSSSAVQGCTPLSKKEILSALYRTTLSKYAMENESDELDLEVNSKDTRVTQGTDLMLMGVAEGIGREQMKVATDIVAAVRPYNWPPAVIAMQMLVMREILFKVGEADYDPQKGRMFYDEGEFERFLSTIQKIARTTHGTAIEAILRKYCVARRGGNSVSSGPRPVADWEFQNASELLSFLSQDDKDICVETLQALGTYSMPLEAITNTILNHLSTHGRSFYEQTKAEVAKRVSKRKTGLSFPVGRTLPPHPAHTPPRTPSPMLPEHPIVPLEDEDHAPVAAASASDNAPNSGWSSAANALPASESRVIANQGWQNAQSSFPVAPNPDRPGHPHSASAAVAGWNNGRPDTNSFEMAPAFETLYNHLQRAVAAPHQPVTQGSASAPVVPLAAPPIIPVAPVYAMAPNLVRSHNPSVLKVGNGPGTFKWWNVSVDAPVASPDDLRLSHAPAVGDVLTWYNPATKDSVGIFTYTEMGWSNVTRSYCLNEGNIVHPGANRLLTWKSEETRTPTWILDKTFRRDKRFHVGLIPDYDVFIKHFALAGNRGNHVTPSSSAGPSTGGAA